MLEAVDRLRGDADAYLTIDGRDIEQNTELALEWSQEAATWAIMGDADEYRLSQTAQAIVRILEEADEPVGPAYVGDLLGISQNTAQQRMYQMSKTGEIKNPARGKYAHNDYKEPS